MRTDHGPIRIASSLSATLVKRKDISFWMDMYKDAEVKRQLYAVPLDSAQALSDYLHCEQKAFTVWRRDKRIGGFLLSEVAPFIATFTIVIHRDFRSRGYGRSLMALVEATALQEGFRTLRADVYSDNTASITRLEKCGFRHFIWLEKNI
jgi:RimJ/RimL family protein N-acetyltransferase